MDDIAIVERLTADWQVQPKYEVFEDAQSDGTHGTLWVGFAAEIGKFQIWIFGNIGKKGGISEEVYIVDPTECIVIDRLRLAERIVAGDGHFLPLRNMRDRVRRGGENPLQVVRECVAESLSLIQAGKIRESHIAVMQEITSATPHFISAGAVSLGRRK